MATNADETSMTARDGPRANQEQGLHARRYRVAKSRANNRVAFAGHAIVCFATCLFLALVVSFKVATIVGLSWLILLAAHGFFFVAAPLLREEWIAEQIQRNVHDGVALERRALGEAHSKSMHRLSAAVAHEIRNPITAAKSLVQQIGEDPTSGDNVEYCRVASEELDRVERAVAHLLRFGREEELHLGDVELRAVVLSALDSVRDRLDGVDLQLDLDQDDKLRADDDKLRRVVINLVGNALDALADAGTAEPMVRISTGHNLAGNEMWLRVLDNGPGIPAERIDDVFDPFHTSKSGGTGLGLAVTQKLVEAHGGSVEVNRDLAEGTEMIVTLPIVGEP